jgi:hypothetical protein
MSDPDMDRWASAWRDDPQAATADLARLARRERRTLYAWIALDWAVGAGLLVFAVWMWLAIGTAPVGFAAIGIWVLTIVVLGFTVINWRGMLAADRSSAAEFLAYAVRRSQARLRYIRFGWKILVADIIVVGGAMALEYRDDGPDRLPVMLASLAAATGSVALLLLWWGRRERRRAERLAAMQRAMTQDPENPHE